MSILNETFKIINLKVLRIKCNNTKNMDVELRGPGFLGEIVLAIYVNNSCHRPEISSNVEDSRSYLAPCLPLREPVHGLSR